MSYIYERFGDLLIPTENGIQRIAGRGATPPTLDKSNGGAHDLYGSARIRPGARTLNMQAFLVGSVGARHAALDAWFAAGGTRQKLWRRSDLDTVQWAWARLVPPDPERHYRRPGYDEISLDFVVTSTYWHGDRHGNGLDLDQNPAEGFDETLTLDYDGSIYDTLFTLSPPSPDSFILNNGGNAPVLDAIITVFADTSALNSIAVTVNGATWTYNSAIGTGGALASGKSLIVDTGGKTVTHNNSGSYAGVYSSFVEPTNQMDWFVLQPGNNTVDVTYSGGGTAPKILFDYYDAWAG